MGVLVADADGEPVRRRRDAGSGTVLVVGVLAAILMTTAGAMQVVAAVVASHRAQSAADLGALAGAAVAAQGGSVASVCAAVAGIVAANGAAVAACSVDAGSAVVLQVSVDPILHGLAGLGPASARSRAGPAPP